MRFYARRPVQLAGLAMALGLAACSSDSNSPPSDAITAEDAESIGYALMGSIEGSALAMTDFSFSPFGPVLAVGPTFRTARPQALMFAGPTDCPSFEPDPAPDADSDGVPDAMTYSFDSETCDEETADGTIDYSGAVHVSDPGATLGYDLTIDGLRIHFTPSGAGSTESIDWDGFRSLRGSSSAILLDEAFEFGYSIGGDQLILLRTTWDLDFVADTPGSITYGDLPAGTLSVDGGFDIVGDNARFILIVDTVQPLDYDPLCADFVGGVIRAWAQGRESEGAVQVTFNACGVAPSVVFVSNPT
jgi:hypothetical protein